MIVRILEQIELALFNLTLFDSQNINLYAVFLDRTRNARALFPFVSASKTSRMRDMSSCLNYTLHVISILLCPKERCILSSPHELQLVHVSSTTCNRHTIYLRKLKCWLLLTAYVVTDFKPTGPSFAIFYINQARKMGPFLHFVPI